MKFRMNGPIVISSILLIASVSNPLTCKIVEFDVPGASKVETAACANDGSCGTFPSDINAAGTIVGAYTDKYLVPHGFIRERGGRSLSFDAPGAGLGHGLDEGTFPIAIGAAGGIVGQYEDANMIFHGFVRESSGSFSTFSAPGAGTTPGSGQGTIATTMNGYGDTAGFISIVKPFFTASCVRVIITSRRSIRRVRCIREFAK